jgi:hypothetical protein
MNLQKTNTSEIEKPPPRLNTDAIDVVIEARVLKLKEWFRLGHHVSRALSTIVWGAPQ